MENPKIDQPGKDWDEKREASFRRDLETFLLKLVRALETAESGKSTTGSLSSKRENLHVPRVGITTFDSTGVTHG